MLARIHRKYYLYKLKERGHLEDRGIEGKSFLTQVLDWIHIAQDYVTCQALVGKVMNFRGEFLSYERRISISRTVVHVASYLRFGMDPGGVTNIHPQNFLPSNRRLYQLLLRPLIYSQHSFQLNRQQAYSLRYEITGPFSL